MKRVPIGVLAILLVACNGPATTARSSGGHPSPPASASASSSGSAVPSGSGSASACRLPIVQWVQGAQGLEPSSGFLIFPNGTFTPDPDGAVVEDAGRYRTTARPSLYGGGPGAGAYDWPLARWLPAMPRSVSPDGSHYAFSLEFGAIHDVEVATGKERVLKAPDGPDTVLYYAREGIYFNHAWEGGPGSGLWLLDPATGKVQTVFSDAPVDAVGGFAAWIPHVNPADAHPIFSSYTGGYLPNQALRRDLNDGRTLPWFYQSGKMVTVIGFDQDRHPLIDVSSGASPGMDSVWLVTGPNQGKITYTGTGVPGIVADTHGIWFGTDHGISLYTLAGGLQKVTNTQATVAGPCR